MNPILIILVVVALVGLLVYRRKRGASARSTDATPAPAPVAETAPLRSAPVHSAPTPLARPVPVVEDMAPPAASRPTPPPSNWVPDETIIEPGWPLPGEIAGAWSPTTSDTGASAAVRDEPVAAISPVPPQIERAPVVEQVAPPRADEWLMPESSPVEWAPGAEDIAPISEVFPVAEPQELEAEPEPEPEFTAPSNAMSETAVTTWDTTAVAEPAIETEEPKAAELPMWNPVATAEPEPVMWSLDAPVEEAAEPMPQAEAVSPFDTWIASPPATEAEIEEEPAPEPGFAPEPVPVLEIPDPAPFVVPDPPAVEAQAVAPEPVDPRDIGRVVAGLAPLLDGLLPLTRVSDRIGVTPRLLVLMRTLADTPLSVSEQATTLGVSRPVVADLTARLESMGLARRERCTVDRRRVRVVLTDRGRRACDEAPIAPEPEAVAERIAQMDPGGRDDVRRALRALERVAG